MDSGKVNYQGMVKLLKIRQSATKCVGNNIKAQRLIE